MPLLTDIEAACNAQALTVLGGFQPEPEDNTPKGCQSLLMIGPNTDFWQCFSASLEYLDGAPDPLDRWSRRVINSLAEELGAMEPLFPFGGPPYAPFIGWAMRTGRVFASPVDLLVHAEHGLMVSFRGALAFDQKIELPQPTPSPCTSCAAKPCQNACPVGALAPGGYDIPACRDHLETSEGKDCLTGGCLVRRACPLDGAQRGKAQSGFHMRAFRGN